jgi:hypothetical protein
MFLSKLLARRSVLEEDFAGRFLQLGAVVVVTARELRIAPFTVHQPLIAHPEHCSGGLVREAVAIDLELPMVDLHVHGIALSYAAHSHSSPATLVAERQGQG